MKSIPRFTVKAPAELMTFLLSVMPGKSRNNIKSLLTNKIVHVNGKPVSQYNHPLNAGDRVVVGFENEPQAIIDNNLKVLYEDRHIIVIDKPSGLLSIATDDEKQDTAYRRVSEYAKQQNEKAKIFILHRLDRDTSGVMMFAKSQEVQTKMQSNWDEVVTDRQYQALVEGHIFPSEGMLMHHLVEGPTGIVHVSNNPELGQEAITHYKTLKQNKQYSLLELKLDTGRKNQIRVQLKEAGVLIVGDKKYGSKANPIGRLGLHAHRLAFIHPVLGKEMVFNSPLPRKMALAAKNRESHGKQQA
ncbi:23S rRNA pseudouridine1911/1915/1917 synthase [Breznakibacter xylanolyticus]|uniref:Pseudouridine synthase n=1 Tax=Breznakibacter xylanolyticus TaxID=990 RepID=A0A2W7NUR3_9BACT|nr:RluA family pseudouridine synthase [Breznakibacter xylanolyticus]PZX20334.1 23S rRNA pseudouridine1911/1915/1917 synthase [Breznakibacter xylanolyticus]